MKNKVMVLIVAGILTVGGISVAYATGRTDTTSRGLNKTMMSTQNSDNNSSNNYANSMMGQQNAGDESNNSYKDMIKIMKDNGFSDEAKAMGNRDFEAMNNLMDNISDGDYKKMIDIMGENGYGSMGNMMRSTGIEGMSGFKGSMMGR